MFLTVQNAFASKRSYCAQTNERALGCQLRRGEHSKANEKLKTKNQLKNLN